MAEANMGSRSGVYFRNGVRSAPPSRDVVIYDGNCQICRKQIARLAGCDRAGSLRFMSLHDARVSEWYPDLSTEKLMQEIYVVTPAGKRHRGAAAFRYLSRRVRALVWLAPLLHIPGSLPFWNVLYQLFAQRRYRFGQSECVQGSCSVHTGTSNSKPDEATTSDRTVKVAATLFSVFLIAAALWPIQENWSDAPRDDFPLSYYPMFSKKRPEIYKQSYFVGLGSGEIRVRIPYQFAGSGGLNQIRRQLKKVLREGTAEEVSTFCRAIADRVAESDEAPYSEIVAVQIVVGHFRLDDYFSADIKDPLKVEVRAECAVQRKQS